MSRIRSVHPGQPTDESFVSCSPFARLLAIFIRNEADDRGIFEWKPLQLKMRIFPADAVDVAALLNELAETEQVARYEVAGKPYGIIRNFLKYQRVRRPSYVHPMPLEGQVPASFLIVPDNDGNGDDLNDDPPADAGKKPAEVGGMRKDVGGKRKGKPRVRAPKPPFEIDDEFRGWIKANTPLVEDPHAELAKYRDWQTNNKAPKNEAAGFRNWLRKANEFAAEKAAKAMLADAKWKAPPADKPLMTYDEPWPQRLRSWRTGTPWNWAQWGPKPGDPGCRVPASLLEAA